MYKRKTFVKKRLEKVIHEKRALDGENKAPIEKHKETETLLRSKDDLVQQMAWTNRASSSNRTTSKSNITRGATMKPNRMR